MFSTLRALFVSSLYVVIFWILYPPARVIAWFWGRWDRLVERRHERLLGPDRVYWN